MCLCFVVECQQEIELNNDRYADSVTVDGLAINDYDGLFDFDVDDSYYCGPTETKPFDVTISYSTEVLLTEVGMHGYFDSYVTSVSLSYSEDDSNFTEYMYAGNTRTTVCIIKICISILIDFTNSVRCSLWKIMRGTTLYSGLPSQPLV